MSEVIGVAIVFMISLPVVAANLIGISSAPTLAEISAFAVAQNVLFVALTVYVVRFRYRLAFSALGIRWERWTMMAAVGIAVGVLTIPTSTIIERAAISIIGAVIGRESAEKMASAEHARDVLTGVLLGPVTTTDIIWVLVIVCVVVPIGEEVFFRGFVFGALRRWGVFLASGLSALFFAAVHQQVVHFPPIFVLGIILALFYERTQSLVPAIVVHGINNLVAILAVLYHWNI